MSRVKSFITAGLIGTALTLGSIGGASANHEGDSLGQNTNQQAANSGNCIGLYSAQVTHNGQVVRGQDRQAEIKALQPCAGGGASQK